MSYIQKQATICLLLLLVNYEANCQEKNILRHEEPKVAIKSNLLYDATSTINLGAEFRLGHRTTLDLPFNWNPFEFSNNRKWKHILVQPELRFWSKEKGAFAGHFFGIHAHYAYYNVGNLPKPPFSQYMADHRFEGWLAGAGVSWGYRWNFNPRWGLEATIGAGYAYLDYDRFECRVCGEKLGSEVKHYLGPTKVGLSLVYQINKKKEVVVEPVPAPLPIIPEKEVAVITPYTPQFTASYVVPEVEAVKQRSDAGKAFLDFEVGQSAIKPSFKNNAAELEKIHSLINSVKNNPDMTITGISIKGFASPEGRAGSNLSLSEKRAQSLKSHIRTMHGLSEALFTVEGKGEDWGTLDSLVSSSFINDKYAILEIIRSSENPDARETKLKTFSGGVPYKEMLSAMFPKLRRSDYQVKYTVIPFTVEKGKEVFRTNPHALSLNEMFLIANTYPAGSEAFNEIFETAARLFPHDDTANLNAAANALERGDKQRAKKYLSFVKEQAGAYYNNMGVLHGLLQEWEKAAEAFQKALNAGDMEAKGNAAENNKAIESRKPANETK